MPRFCLDTSALTFAMRDTYPMDVFPKFWQLLEKGIVDGDFISSQMVLEEIGKKDDDLFAWCKSNSGLFVKVDQATLNSAISIIREHSKIVDPKRDRDGADPFVIALAKVTRTTVVTQEKASGGPHRLKIPDVCTLENIACVNTLKMIRILGWKIS